MLAEVFLRWRVRDQSELFVPAKLLPRGRRALRPPLIFFKHKYIAMCAFQLRPIPQCLHKLQRHHRRAAIHLLRRHPSLKILAPIHKWPPRNLPQQSIRSLPRQKPVQRRSHSRPLPAHKLRIPSIRTGSSCVSTSICIYRQVRQLSGENSLLLSPPPGKNSSTTPSMCLPSI